MKQVIFLVMQNSGAVSYCILTVNCNLVACCSRCKNNEQNIFKNTSSSI
jgi:hypothetical protein